MKALVCRELGDIRNLEVADMPSPVPAADEIRIRVAASGVNFPDILMVEGKYQVKPALPFVPGLEVAGTVIECGAEVDRLRPGDRVMAFTRFGGGHAEEAVAPAAIATRLPDAVDDVTAAAFPVAYGTAHFALDYRGRLRAGETLLVTGATGGVGLAAIEVGKMLGARVIAAAGGEEKVALARAYGADEVVDYRAENLRDRVRELTDGQGVDVVFEPVGGEVFGQCVRCVGYEGRILVVGFASGDIPTVATNLVLVKNFSVVGVVFGEHSRRHPAQTRDRLTGLLAACAEGRLKPRVMKTCGLEGAADALAEMAGRRVMGKIVLTR